MGAATDNNPEKRPSENLSVEDLLSYAKMVLAEMAGNRDLRSEGGKPCYRVRHSGEDARASYVQFEADISAIGMPTNSPLSVAAYSGDGSLEWSLGPVSIAKTPRTASPKEAADALNMDVLLKAHRQFVAAESVLFATSMTPRKESVAVFIDLEDGCCRECSGVLEVTGVDDVTMEVECCECGDCYPVEHDAFEGSKDYVLEFLSRRGLDAE